MKESTRVLSLHAIVVGACTAVALAALAYVYHATYAYEEQRLASITANQRTLIQSVSEFDNVYSADYPEGPHAATVHQLKDYLAQYQNSRDTEEVVIGCTAHPPDIVLLTSHNPEGLEFARGQLEREQLAEPLRAALAGATGTLEGRDYRGEVVLAAYASVPGTPFFVVTKVDRREVRAPFRRALPLILGMALLASLTGVWGIRRITSPIIQQLRHDQQLLREQVAARTAEVQARARAEAELAALNRELEQHVRRRTAQLEEANKELEAFSYSVSHDLRAPLRSIDGFSRILLDEHADALSPDARRQLGVVRQNAQKMGQLIDDMLQLSRLSRKELAREQVDIRELAEDKVATFLHLYPGASFDIVYGDLPPAPADHALAGAVLQNLLGNAMKFSSKGPAPRVEISTLPGSSPPVYYVRDNGVGFDMKYAHKLFGVFQRLHRAEEFPGTGVGLAIVHRVVHRHGGRVWAESEPGKGSTFYFTLQEENVP